MRADIRITDAAMADAEGIALIHDELGWFPAGGSAGIAGLRRHLALCLADDSHDLLVAKDGSGAVVGYLAVHWLPYLFLPGPEGYISELFLRAAARGGGIGARLLDVVKERARARGCCRLLLVNNRTRDSYARGFYPKQGWEERPEMANMLLRLDAPE